eukprot:CAMPEP_0176304360 /NCGR_PEP_ID=MMETSP0121_2-20121125/62389_1 /TAXON_ID=160619 /ORGANISM="Kryptoperidinium foliaceum, Strain CCMP 1326" /LENGTH=32 /DNA_ID= /DNA_START= /DNA_END= /DNA_ORIENTATION=
MGGTSNLPKAGNADDLAAIACESARARVVIRG